jgi:prophage regulatory protein
MASQACQWGSTIGYVEYDTRHIVGAHEIGDMLGVTRSRANQLARERGFPKPLGVLRMGKVWRRADIETWIRKRKAPDG